MVNQKIKLTRPGLFLPSFYCEENLESKVIVRPTILSICAADQRYFKGLRSPDVLKEKLPMCLIHEAIGRVIEDPLKRIPSGQNVILLPNGGNNKETQNYSTHSFFRSSNSDGFTQEVLGVEFEEILPFHSPFPKYYVLAEIISVCYHAISQIPLEEWERINRVGIWGDGIVSYLLSLCIKREYPGIHVSIFGKHEEKLILFSHTDSVQIVYRNKTFISPVEMAFEAVGGGKAGEAINQIIEAVAPRSYVCLTGVSEELVPISTRRILEKGLTLRGTSRSLRKDFIKAKGLLDSLCDFSVLDKIISKEIVIHSSEDLTQAFYQDQKVPFKTFLDWKI